MNTLWIAIVRFRTWIANVALLALVLLPELLNSPQILAVIPAEYQRYAIAAAFILNIWMRPRPAVISTDPEASISRGRK